MKNELSAALNQYLANVAVGYVKFHNLHWNVVGSSFKQVHEYLETLYDGFADILDSVAELLKMHDVQPLASMKDYLAAATIQKLRLSLSGRLLMRTMRMMWLLLWRISFLIIIRPCGSSRQWESEALHGKPL